MAHVLIKSGRQARGSLCSPAAGRLLCGHVMLSWRPTLPSRTFLSPWPYLLLNISFYSFFLPSYPLLRRPNATAHRELLDRAQVHAGLPVNNTFLSAFRCTFTMRWFISRLHYLTILGRSAIRFHFVFSLLCLAVMSTYFSSRVPKRLDYWMEVL